jgi:hypothetical protein
VGNDANDAARRTLTLDYAAHSVKRIGDYRVGKALPYGKLVRHFGIAKAEYLAAIRLKAGFKAIIDEFRVARMMIGAQF